MVPLTMIVVICPIRLSRSAFLCTKLWIISMNSCSTLGSSCLGDSTTNRLGISNFIRSITKLFCFLPLLYASPTRFIKLTMHFLQLVSENLHDKISTNYGTNFTHTYRSKPPNNIQACNNIFEENLNCTSYACACHLHIIYLY